MKAARHVYRAKAVEPLIVGLMLFQAASGFWMSWKFMGTRIDRFRAFQIASGIYLAFYVIGHMDSVFILARTYLGIDTDWAFATGAPSGLTRDPWNIRLLPHYWLGVFFVLSHIASGLRGVLLAQGWRKSIADKVMIGGSVAGGSSCPLSC
jgi:succinate dehydrogenase hydrophobic anchor subunit